MRSTHGFALVVLVVLLTSLDAPVAATESGLITLAVLQTARLNVVDLRPVLREHPSTPCVAALGFRDLSGAPFRDRMGRPVASEARLDPGSFASLELPSSVVLQAGALRGAFRAVVVPDRESSEDPCAGLVATVEVYESLTGRTTHLVNLGSPEPAGRGLQHADDDGRADKRVAPGLPARQFGLAGLTRLQAGRVTVADLGRVGRGDPGGACLVTMSFVDESGNPFIQGGRGAVSQQVALAAGESAALELSPSIAFQSTRGSRRLFRAVVDGEPTPPEASSACVDVTATMEAVDLATGRTSYSDLISNAVSGSTALENGVPVFIDGIAGSMRRFHIEVPPGAADLDFVMSGGTGDADLYVKLGSPPTTTSWDARPYLNGNNESVQWSNPVPGTWYVMVRGYEAYAGVTLRAVFTEPPPPPAGTIVLEKNVPVTGLSGALGSQISFQITVPAGTQFLTIQMGGGTGDADLYVRFGVPPTFTAWYARPFLLGNNESVSVTDPQSGTWYVMVDGYDEYSGVSLIATYSP